MTRGQLSRRRALQLGGAAVVAAVSAGCSADGGSDRTRVSMTEDFAFDPDRLTVASGTTVTWVNDSQVGHTVTAYEDDIPTAAAYFASGDFDTERAARNDVRGGLLASGETYEHTFEVSGTYEYVCVPHESSGMTGTVVVE